VTGDTPGTATEIARQIGLWNPETDTERNRITGVAFSDLSDEEALDRVMDLKIMSRARPTDKQRLVQLLQQKGAVVAVTGDGTNDAPALNHAQVNGSSVPITEPSRTINSATKLIVNWNTMKRWMFLYSERLIISKAMRSNIIGVGSVFLIILLGMIYYFDHSTQGMDIHNLTVFFTFFVMLQFWNLFNARVFGTTDSAFKGLSKSYGMELIVLAILVGQFLIVQFGGAVFRTVRLTGRRGFLL